MDRHPYWRRSHAASACRIALAAAPLLLVAGCFSGHATYPQGWSPAVAQSATQADSAAGAVSTACPNLEGRYSNRGELASSTPRDLCEGPSRNYRYVGDWRCETGLASNIAGLDLSSFDTVVLRQPDADTLEVLSGASAAVSRELHRSKGDFDCKDEGLARRLIAPALSFGDETDAPLAVDAINAFRAAMGVFMASAGLQTLTRTFTRAADGSLVMTVERATFGLVVGLPYGYEYSTYVIWPPAAVSNSQADPVRDSQRAPEPTVTWLPFRTWLMGPAWFVAVDDREYGFRPVDVDPGLHWVEFYALDARKPRYGTMVDLEAGHTYQLADGPPDCSPTRGADGKDAGDQLQWREVQVSDRVEGQPATIHTVKMMCRRGAHRCEADTECDRGERCVHYPGGGWGYCGTSPPD
jgi:hypothetical protein